ncbi:family 20 glycosylhydrolase [Marinihelvus fidelis]|uniref:beta-N-acetylhexosaminidase n=1 Tax=Marinihelvus fidelis TaxID=2613842 RepID=A0A5N0TJN5_9GAMM|nr:beta-N-acetylhexosaminidase [Marinihelvus fidelis]KAA9134126.1 family 20 glycosylhydrolase [Marinihelvus fidelis]
MKRLIPTLLVGLITTMNHDTSMADMNIESGPSAGPVNLPLIPYPRSVTPGPGQLRMAGNVTLSTPDEAENASRALREWLADRGINVSMDTGPRISLSLGDAQTHGAEGYRLSIADDIRIEAATDTGLFYGVQTLRQLFPVQAQPGYTLPHVVIDDRPEFEWRGNMLDVARSFLPLEYLRAHIDRMSRFKLNRLHLHLSDDQGWRVEIKAFPKLTEVGGASSVEGGRSGFYTQAELRELVAYGEARGVIIVPEIDLPGHTQAAIASYPELACPDVTNLSTYSGVEVGFSKLCLTQPETTYSFTEGVLTEIVDIFPSPYIHIGGDEIKDPLYAEFIGKATRIVESLGRTAVAWEEASVADNDPGVLLQLWNDEYDIQPALDRGHRLILSPCSYTYFDHGNYEGQPNTYTWCRKEGVPMERAYQFNPQSYSQVHGVESAMWSELVHTDATADNRLWPRVLTTAEIGWSPAEARNYEQFLDRLEALRPQLDAMGIQYYRPQALP